MSSGFECSNVVLVFVLGKCDFKFCCFHVEVIVCHSGGGGGGSGGGGSGGGGSGGGGSGGSGGGGGENERSRVVVAVGMDKKEHDN